MEDKIKIPVKKESKFKTMLDIEILDWFLSLESDFRNEILDKSKAKNWKELVNHIKENS